MTYIKQGWADGVTGATPLSADRLNHMEDGIALAAPLVRTGVKSAGYTAAPGELVPVDTATPNANITIQLPTAPTDGSRICVKHIAVGAGKTVTVARGGTDVFNKAGGATTLTLTLLNQAITVQYDSGIWTVTSDDFPVTALTAASSPMAKSTVSLLGDSKTNNHGSVAAGLSNKGYFTWAQIFLRNRVSVIGVHGYPGQRSDEIYANVGAAIADAPGWCFVDVGTNDVAQVGGLDSIGQTISAATIVAWMKSIFATLKATGIRPIANTIMPRTGLTGAQSKVQFDVNDWLRRFCPANGIVLVDPFAIWADPASGQPLAGYTVDGVHPASNGAAAWGQAIASVLDRVIPPSERLPFSGGTAAGGDNSNIGSELLFNPMLAGDGGTGVASGWTLTTAGTVTKSKVPRTDGAGGEWQQIKLGAAASSAALTQNVGVPNSSGVGSPDTLYAGVEIQTDDDFNGITALYLKLQITAGTGNGTTAYAVTPDDAAQATNPYPATITLVTPGLVVPAGATSVAFTLLLAGTGGTIRAARAFIRSQAVA